MKKALNYLVIILFSVIVSFIVPYNMVLAVSNDFYSNNDIIFYSGNSNQCNNTNSTSVAEKVWSYFIQKGLTPEQTAGIMGNMYQESSISPTAWQTVNTTDKTSLGNIESSTVDNHAWGIVQWDHDRKYSIYIDRGGGRTESGVIGKIISEKPNLVKYLDSSYSSGGAVINGSANAGYTLKDENPLSSKNIPESDLNELLTFELDYAWSEMPSEYKSSSSVSALDAVKATSTILDATVAFHDYFERSDDSPEFVRTVRYGYAQAIYNKLKNTSVNASSADCSTDNAFIDTVKKYTWPTFKGWYDKNGSSSTGTVAITPTADYQTAITNAKAAGRYTGDSCFTGGIDCGGFVTTLIHDSGWDTTYNYNALISDGAGGTSTQIQWLNANWTNLGNAASIDTGTLQPGDVAIYNNSTEGHVFVYIGKVDGFDSVVASASQCQRAPMSGKESLVDAQYTWYRKK